MIGNKIANKITKKSPKSTLKKVGSETEILKKRSISPEKIQQIIYELRLI